MSEELNDRLKDNQGKPDLITGNSAIDSSEQGVFKQYVAKIENSVVTGVVTGQIRGNAIFSEDERVAIRFPKRESVYYSVTESEIDSYATFGLLSNLSLTLFGLLAGFAFGCLAALAQGNIPEQGRITLSWLTGFSIVTSLVFLVSALFLAYLQNSSKKHWRTKSNDNSKS